MTEAARVFHRSTIEARAKILGLNPDDLVEFVKEQGDVNIIEDSQDEESP